MRLALVLAVLSISALALLGTTAAPVSETTATARADTLRFEVVAGDPLVIRLPGTDETRYRVLHAPALAHLVDRSFAWTTLPGERGRELILLLRTEGGRSDTLVLAVDVR